MSFCSRMFCGVELPLLPPPCGFGGSVDGAVGAGGANICGYDCTISRTNAASPASTLAVGTKFTTGG